MFVVELQYNVDRAGREPSHRAHAEYLASLTERGVLRGAGPLVDANGGLLVYDVPDRAALQEVLDNEPYVQAGLVAQTLVREWNPGKGSWFTTAVS
ncbi:hypothetical protein GCM10010174_56060 [Kutzneria viridogrisea]|uniref:YCII-related domain-containing protein n=2 Tax=Kutzneria TaxID=43356 RepID=W5WAD2_9PSEU|nr:YciI family protein [Kutzneria albida]AHH95129.1 hypothetical protein KALB_1758 [Kutzneria albida DSM 43870]MBA8927513.1 hypothetical protein [Kutzneria viridogrisea]